MSDVPTTDPAEIAALHSELIRRIIATPEGVKGFSGATKVIGFKLREPDLTMKLILDGENSTLYQLPDGESLDADISVVMSWQTAHNFWTGKVDLMGQLLTGKVKVEGSDMDPLFRLKTLVPQARAAYSAIMVEKFS